MPALIPTGTHSIKITQPDLTGDCYRLNRRFDLIDNTISQIAKELAGLGAGGSASSSSGPVLEDTHDNRIANYPASSYDLGQIFFETDTGVFLLVEEANGENVWRPRWSNPIEDTHSNRSTTVRSPVFYPDGMPYFENDRGLLYISEAGTGSGNVTGGVNFQRTLGQQFNASWADYVININGLPVRILSVTDADNLVLATALVDGGKSFSMPSALWHYASGVYTTLFSSRPILGGLEDVGFQWYASDVGIWEQVIATGNPSPPTEWVYLAGVGRGDLAMMNIVGGVLGVSEEGVLFAESDYQHMHRWNGAGWEFDPGDPGSGYFVFGPMPIGGFWSPLNGSSYACMQGDGSTATVVTPNWNGTVAALMGGANSGTLQPASATTFQAGTTVGGPTGSGDLDPKAPSVANGGLPQYFQMTGWVRR